MTTHPHYGPAVEAIRKVTDRVPDVGLVLGSGLGVLADELSDRIAVSYEDIPGWPRSTVHGHSGRLVFGTLEGKQVVCQQGRAHFYEGYTPQQITFPIRVMHFLGVKTLILTNAAGGINLSYEAGDIMLLNDHINFIGMAGANPLVGPNDDALGERFIGMSTPYDTVLRSTAKDVASVLGLAIHEGTYACLSGPTFESPAEVRMLRILGADAVGMSTVHEVLVARQMSMRVLAFSAITNKGIDVVDSPQDANHEEVLETGKVIVPKLSAIVRGVLARI
ncbi:MAG: purine-nucleoside phosphorylase [Chloroflexi bacterium]|nr:purine-nucleoside phosphorylase [Chloroflexota bacterium]